jgi:hypothetical protein
MALVNATNIYSNSKYIVSQDPGSPYPTIQSAITAVHNAGESNVTVWVRRGIYTENLTLYNGINLEGEDPAVSIIRGYHTPPQIGTVSFSRLALYSSPIALDPQDIFVYSGPPPYNAALSCARCRFQVNSAYVYNLPTWTGSLTIEYSTDSSTENGLVYNTAGASVTIHHSVAGAGNTRSLTTSGSCHLLSVDIGCPLVFSGAGVSLIDGMTSMSYPITITVTDSHSLTITNSRIWADSSTAITQNSAAALSLENVIVDASVAPTITGTGAIKTMHVAFPNSNTLSVAQTPNGIGLTTELWSNNIERMQFSGFYNWTSGAPYYDASTPGTFILLSGGSGYIHNRVVNWNAPQTYSTIGPGGTYYLFIQDDGSFNGTPAGLVTTPADINSLYFNNIVLFDCFRDSTLPVNNQIVVKDNHSYNFLTSVENWIYDSIGAVIDNINQGANVKPVGVDGVGIDQLDYLSDRGLITAIPDSGVFPLNWLFYYTSDGTPAGNWVQYNSGGSTAFPLKYNLHGAPTNLTAGQLSIFRLYVSKDSLNTSDPHYIAVMDFSFYTSQRAANAAIFANMPAKATNPLASLALAQLGFVTVSSTSITDVVPVKTVIRPDGFMPGSAVADLVSVNTSSFTNWLSSDDSTVQQALDDLDQIGAGVSPPNAIVIADTSHRFATIPLTDGQLPIGFHGAAPVAATLTGGAGIAIASAAGSITISATAVGLAWSIVSSISPLNPIVLTNGNGYVCVGGGTVTFILPLAPALGDAFTILNQSQKFQINQNANQQIRAGTVLTTPGGTGYLVSNSAGDQITLVYTQNNLFVSEFLQGTLTLF